MTHEREAIDALAQCRFVPGSFAKRFARDMAAKAENFRLSPKQRETLWKLVVSHRHQIKAEHVERARWWLGRSMEQIAFEQMLDASPTDFQTRLIYADWLEERGDSLCVAQRWMVKHSASPRLWARGVKGEFGWMTNYEWTMKSFAMDTMPYWHKSREGAEQCLANVLTVVNAN